MLQLQELTSATVLLTSPVLKIDADKIQKAYLRFSCFYSESYKKNSLQPTLHFSTKIAECHNN